MDGIALLFLKIGFFFRARILPALFIACLLLFAPNAFGESKKSILILNSYHPGYKWTDDETQGVIAALDPMKNDIRLYIEYMGTKWTTGRHYFQQLRDIYKQKFGHVTFSVIVVSDDDAFDFLLMYRDELFGKVPVVFCGVNYFRDEDLKGRTRFTGVSETADIKGSLDTALRLHPATKEIVVINEPDISGRKVHEEIMQVIPLYQPAIRFTFLENVEMKKLLETVEKLPLDSFIFYTFFFTDKQGAFYEYDESLSLLSARSPVPIYGAWDFNLGYGIVGGKLTSGFEQGKTAGEMSLRILQGENVEQIPIIKQSPTRYMFDYHQMERFNIKVSDLPQGSIVINKPTSFYQVNKNLVWWTLAGLVVMIGVAIVLLINIQQRREAEASLRGEIEERKQAEVALQKARDELEMRVRERTTDLAAANEHLLAEIVERKRAEEKLRDLSEKDPLTQIYNRRKLFELLEMEIRKSKRHQRPLSVILFDLDHFKSVNDTYGHDRGDQILKTTTSIVSDTIRKTDISARYGGEEFIVVLPETGLEGAAALAEKMRSNIEQYSDPDTGMVTISAGVAEFRSEDTGATLIKRADGALYAAKRKGRNRVIIADPPTQSGSSHEHQEG
jgi:diguanylate cyclase (GGDEF)-like protein